jgi:hypothetical protein
MIFDNDHIHFSMLSIYMIDQRKEYMQLGLTLRNESTLSLGGWKSPAFHRESF